MYEVSTLDSFDDDLEKILNYISYNLYNPQAASKLSSKIQNALHSLEKFPKSVE